MKWSNLREHYPNQWVLFEALDAYSQDGKRIVKWVMCKFKRFRGHRKRAETWLSKVRKREPNLFAHWKYRKRNVVMS